MASVAEARRNYEAFQELLPELSETHPGECALLHDGQLVEVFPTRWEARSEGKRSYPGAFSIQPITTKALDLGWFSHVRG